MKSGIKTTEFWLSVLAKIIGVLAGLGIGGKIGMVVAAASAVLVALGYSTGRAKVKAAEVKALGAPK